VISVGIEKGVAPPGIFREQNLAQARCSAAVVPPWTMPGMASSTKNLNTPTAAHTAPTANDSFSARTAPRGSPGSDTKPSSVATAANSASLVNTTESRDASTISATRSNTAVGTALGASEAASSKGAGALISVP
jgi:hypothetical protein